MSKRLRGLLGDLKWDLWTRWTGAEAADGCCDCGGPTAHYRYWRACPDWEGKDVTVPDWEACKWCHNGTDGHAAWLRTLRHEVKV